MKAGIMFHLPDLPIVGYATRKEREGTDSIMDFLRKIERERLRLLTIVCDGPDKWRKVANSVFRGSNVDDEAVLAMYRYLVLMAARPTDQVRLVQAETNAARYRDEVTRVMPDIERQLDAMQIAQKWSPYRAQ